MFPPFRHNFWSKRCTHTYIYVHIRSNLGSRLFWIKFQRPRYFVSGCQVSSVQPSVQCPVSSTMAGRMAGSNGMSSDESEDQVKEAAAASQSTSGMASVAAGSSSTQEPGRVYKDAGSGSQKATSGGKKKNPSAKPVCCWCQNRTQDRQCSNFHCQHHVCDEHLQHRWLNGGVSNRRYCPCCMAGPVRDYKKGPLIGQCQ